MIRRAAVLTICCVLLHTAAAHGQCSPSALGSASTGPDYYRFTTNDSNHTQDVSSAVLMTLRDTGVTSISLSYRLDERTDRYGNRLRYRGRATLIRHGRFATPLVIYDVFFVPAP
jgi:hypothetical protein